MKMCFPYRFVNSVAVPDLELRGKKGGEGGGIAAMACT